MLKKITDRLFYQTLMCVCVCNNLHFKNRDYLVSIDTKHFFGSCMSTFFLIELFGFCSCNATNNLTSKKQKVCSLCYWHTETRRRKGCKWCDLFYGGECDKLT